MNRLLETKKTKYCHHHQHYHTTSIHQHSLFHNKHAKLGSIGLNMQRKSGYSTEFLPTSHKGK